MSWTAPPADRTDTPNVADERTTLDAFVDFHRQTLLHKCAGLTTEQLKSRAVEPSSMSLLGLVRHMTEVERSWFQRRVAGHDVPFIYCAVDDNPDGDFDDVAEADAEADFAVYAREVELSRAVARSKSLDDTFLHPVDQVDFSVRWVYVHLIEEYARHNGHADLLRERIDGATGI